MSRRFPSWVFIFLTPLTNTQEQYRTTQTDDRRLRQKQGARCTKETIATYGVGNLHYCDKPSCRIPAPRSTPSTCATRHSRTKRLILRSTLTPRSNDTSGTPKDFRIASNSFRKEFSLGTEDPAAQHTHRHTHTHPIVYRHPGTA